ncbi:LacI family DNA-binding transcriptional regulator [Phenylobacterium sp.]|uniref:LacI family DNA-binding transcriptional regulator n=1 Tax=Phenylobacterium sp. TaxID=1871053 RepID=UPI003524E7CB
MARQPTIKDVAARAGVSFKTVSRVLNGEPHVRQELREKITAAVAELGYRPSVAARGLIGAPSRLIAFLYDNPNFGYVAEAELGALIRCRRAGYYVAVEPIDSQGDVGRQIEQILSSLRVDGLILTPPISDNAVAIAAIERLGVRYVRIAPWDVAAGSASIVVDDAHGASALTSRLLELGHERIAFVQGPQDHGASHLRLRGYLEAMRQGGREPDANLIVQGGFTFESGEAAGEQLIALAERPTAVFASNDEMAFGVMAAARRAGLDIPGDLSVAGFDDTRSARMSWPPLATVRQPIADMCAAAADMLIAAASGAPAAFRSMSLSTELIERASIGPR